MGCDDIYPESHLYIPPKLGKGKSSTQKVQAAWDMWVPLLYKLPFRRTGNGGFFLCPDPCYYVDWKNAEGRNSLRTPHPSPQCLRGHLKSKRTTTRRSTSAIMPATTWEHNGDLQKTTWKFHFSPQTQYQSNTPVKQHSHGKIHLFMVFSRKAGDFNELC